MGNTPEDFAEMSNDVLDSYLKSICQEITDQDDEALKPLRNAIEEVRERWALLRKFNASFEDL